MTQSDFLILFENQYNLKIQLFVGKSNFHIEVLQNFRNYDNLHEKEGSLAAHLIDNLGIVVKLSPYLRQPQF